MAPSGGAAEVDDLAATVNEMLARLEAAIGGERAAASAAREFAANAAHELRTPMAALGANLEILGRPDLPADMVGEVTAAARAEGVRMAELLGALELLARGALTPSGVAQVVDLGDLLDAAVRRRPPATP